MLGTARFSGYSGNVTSGSVALREEMEHFNDRGVPEDMQAESAAPSGCRVIQQWRFGN